MPPVGIALSNSVIALQAFEKQILVSCNRFMILTFTVQATKSWADPRFAPRTKPTHGIRKQGYG